MCRLWLSSIEVSQQSFRESNKQPSETLQPSFLPAQVRALLALSRLGFVQ